MVVVDHEGSVDHHEGSECPWEVATKCYHPSAASGHLHSFASEGAIGNRQGLDSVGFVHAVGRFHPLKHPSWASGLPNFGSTVPVVMLAEAAVACGPVA